MAELVGPSGLSELAHAQHMPNWASMKIALLIREAMDQHGMDGFAMMRLDEQRAGLIDHLGACERIAKTPVPKVYAIKVRQFITLFLLTLPFALLHRLETDWLIPLITMLVSYPLVALDQISIELQDPFNNLNLSPLPLMTSPIPSSAMSRLFLKHGPFPTATSMPRSRAEPNGNSASPRKPPRWAQLPDRNPQNSRQEGDLAKNQIPPAATGGTACFNAPT